MDCTDVAAVRLLVGEMSSTALYQAVTVISRSDPFCPLEVIMVRVQVQGNVPPLNKIGEMPFIPLRNRKVG